MSSLFSCFKMTAATTSHPVDLLVLGAGWTYTFLGPLLASHHPSISVRSTTRDGRDGSLKWAWDPEGPPEQYRVLPKAKTVVIVFPLKGVGGSRAIVEGYEAAHGSARWIQLGSSGIWDVSLHRGVAFLRGRGS